MGEDKAFAAQIKDHSTFFDHLVNLVSAKFYYGTEQAEDLKHMRKTAREAERKARKERAKVGVFKTE